MRVIKRVMGLCTQALCLVIGSLFMVIMLISNWAIGKLDNMFLSADKLIKENYCMEEDDRDR